MIAAGDAEAIERATLAALPPRVLVVDDGWLLGANDGVISRANSVVPLGDGEHRLDEKIGRAIAFYERQGLPPVFRLSPFSQPARLSEALSSRGFTPEMTTLVMTGRIDGLDASVEIVALGETPSRAWRTLFIEPGVGASEADIRLATLSRGQGTRFASLEIDGDAVAIGAASVTDGWAGLHGMRTLARHRGRGYGAKVLSRLLDDARKRGAQKAFLQVEEANRDAIRLYERLGFRTAYAYDYWRAPR